MMVLYSPAKLNLYLDVLNKRPDGYHNIRTIFERISLFDKIIFRAAKGNRIRIRSDSKDMPSGRSNLVYKAARLLKKDFAILAGLDIEIKKRIPIGAGLGGASSNAAAALLGLNRLWRLNLNRRTLLDYAARLGSDVAFFLYDKSFALGSGRGERIRPIENLKKKFWHIVIVPNVKVLTKDIYQALDKPNDGQSVLRPGLTEDQLLRQVHIQPGAVSFNRLEETTFKKYPEVKKIKEHLENLRVKNVLMSGSGSAVFGIVNSRKEGLRLARFFRRSKNLKIFVVKTA